MKQSITPSNMLALLFFPAFKINSLIRSFTLPNSHHWLLPLKPGNGFTNSLAEVPLASSGAFAFHAIGIITFIWWGFSGRKCLLTDKKKHLNPERHRASPPLAGMVPRPDTGRRGLCWRESPCKAWAFCLCFHQAWAYTFSGQRGSSLESTGVTVGGELKS